MPEGSTKKRAGTNQQKVVADTGIKITVSQKVQAPAKARQEKWDHIGNSCG